MTESQWLGSDDVAAMLYYLMSPSDNANQVHLYPPGHRKLRLFACACCLAVSDELGADAEWCMLNEAGAARDAANWARGWAGDQKTPPPAVRAALLRCVVGNPFRPVTLPRVGVHCPACGASHFLPEGPGSDDMFCRECFRKFPWPTDACTIPILRWQGGMIPMLAEKIYQDRTWHELGILRDMLEDAGCDNEDMLRHLAGQQRCPWCKGSAPPQGRGALRPRRHGLRGVRRLRLRRRLGPGGAEVWAVRRRGILAQRVRRVFLP